MNIDLNLLKDATRSALRDVRDSSGIESDPDLRIYKSLKPEDFPALVQRYGPAAVKAYIDTMESKLQQKG